MDNKILLSLDAYQVEYLVEMLLNENRNLHSRCEMFCEENSKLSSRLEVMQKIERDGVGV